MIMLFSFMAVTNPCGEIPLFKFTDKQIKIFEENGFIFYNDEVIEYFSKEISINGSSCLVLFILASDGSASHYNYTSKMKFRFEITHLVNIEDMLENLDLMCTEMTTYDYDYRLASFEYNSRKLTVLISVNVPINKDGIIMAIDNGFHVYRDNKLTADEVLFLHTEKMNKDQS
jgi:hypothetical protein